MRVLLANKFFYPKGGSEAVFFLTRQLLERHGHDVIDFAMKDPRNVESPYADYFAPARSYTESRGGKLTKLVDAATSVYSPAARMQMRRLLRDTQPDVAHLHNVYYQLTLSIVDELHASRVPTVMTLHDSQLACPAHTLYRDGQDCRECVGRLPVPSIKHRCVKGSTAASALGALESTLNRAGRKFQKVNRVITPSSALADVAIDAGIAPDQLDQLPNFLFDEQFDTPVEHVSADCCFLYAGQLEEGKGVADLLAAFASPPVAGAVLLIAGDGLLRAKVEEAAASVDHIDYLGPVSHDGVRERLRGSRAAILPARWPENNPMSILEARSLAIPVITSSAGGLPEMVDHGRDGLMFEPGNHKQLAAAVCLLANDRSLAETLGRAGHARASVENSAERHYQSLLHCYSCAIEAAKAT